MTITSLEVVVDAEMGIEVLTETRRNNESNNYGTEQLREIDFILFPLPRQVKELIGNRQSLLELRARANYFFLFSLF